MDHPINGIQLESSDFQIVGGQAKLINSKNVPGMLLIQASWCGFCKRFIPIYNTLQSQINNQQFSIVSIDESQISSTLKTALKFQGYPTIKFFDKYGRLTHTYDGVREEKPIKEAICNYFHLFCSN